MNNPKLDPPCSGWVEDLPEPHTPPVTEASLGYYPPNHLDDIYLEVPRYSSLLRGIFLWFGVFIALGPFYIGSPLIQVWPYINATNLALILPPFVFSIGWGVPFFIRSDVSPPRDEPIRFNRARQKIYAYNFEFNWWNPFGRWRVVPVAYDWSQVRAERWKKRGATAQGGVIVKWGVVLSIVRLGTNQVIDRFCLSTMGADENAWAYVCTYMQQGPSALPTPDPPRDHNDIPWYNLALRLAPKVQWPDEMDRESRTAP